MWNPAICSRRIARSCRLSSTTTTCNTVRRQCGATTSFTPRRHVRISDPGHQRPLVSPATECSICMETYAWQTRSLQPISLSCGHSFCRGCLRLLTEKRCPCCREFFIGNAIVMAPNFALRDSSTALAEFPRKKAFRAPAPAEIPLQAIGKGHQTSAVSPNLPPLSQLPAGKSTTTFSLPLSLPTPATAPVTTDTQRRTLWAGATTAPSAVLMPLPPPRLLAFIIDTDIRELQSIINACTAPTIFNLCGQVLGCERGTGLWIMTNNVTLKNCTFMTKQTANSSRSGRSSGTCVTIIGVGVELDNVTFRGAHKGVSVAAGGQLTMRNCQVHGCHTGIAVCNTGFSTAMRSLIALDVLVLGCGCGMLSVDAAVFLKDCTVSRSYVENMRVLGASRLMATHVACSHAVRGLVVRGGAWAMLQGCAVAGNAIYGVHVKDATSRVELIGCTVDAQAITRCGGRFSMR